MQDTNLLISDEELKIILNGDFFIKKRAVSNKIRQAFIELKDNLETTILKNKQVLPASIDLKDSKISRGENYRFIPYIVLDYPKLYAQENIFTYRSMFLWGNFFSFTLHLSGDILNDSYNIIINNLNKLEGKDFYFCINNNPWEYFYGSDNYISLDEMLKLKLPEQRSFIKLSRKLHLTNYSKIQEYGVETLSELFTIFY